MTMRRGLVDQGDKFVKSVSSDDKRDYKVVDRGQLVVGFPIDEAVLAFQRLYDEGIVSPAYGVWDLTATDVHRGYLERYLRSPRAIEFYRAKLRGSTARRRSLPASVFLSMPVPVPEESEQRRIAAILDQADELRAKRRRTLTLLEQLSRAAVDSFMAEADAVPTLLRDVLSVPLRNGVSPSTRGTHRARVLTLTAVTGGAFDMKHSRDAEFDTFPARQKYVSRQDFLICRGNGNRDLVGQGVLVPDTPKVAVLFPDTVIAVKLDQDCVVPEFFAAQWATAAVRRQIRAISRTTNGTFKVNQAGLANVVIHIPALRAQLEFVAEVRKIKDAIAKNEVHLAHLDELFASLQHRAFTGQL
jgi:type I restriction enzyme S subunit